MRKVAARLWSAMTRSEPAWWLSLLPPRHLAVAHRDYGQFGGAADERDKEVGVVVADHALQDGGDAFESGSGVDGGLGQRVQDAVGAAVELHEDEVPDFDVAAALAGEFALSGGALGEFAVAGGDAHVVVDLRAGAAGAGVAHLPEVFLHAQFEDALGLDAGLEPEVVGFVVARDAILSAEDGDVELVGAAWRTTGAR